MIPIDMWTFLTIVAVASILIGAFSEYHKNKLKHQKMHAENRDTVRDLETQLASLRKRIENLEVIAASDSESFADRRKSIILDDLETDEDEGDSEHQRLVNELAKKRRQKS
jgi:hypothetical protein